ncbi:MAG: NnrS family protein [Rhodoferax sp.]|jgi:uncharacterized protein involved in response to NO|nr:NnrS family protein [Rhodoferax sp.]MBP6492667.1 NnrS family protein [Rhodoferax sp.]MBP7572385.1 NnrS family protein [Rhodoferax sp.]HPW07327.1 NnrS family protein [Burkholderiaceae bacterium]
MATLIQIQSPPKRGQFRFALWDLGFRPFYLLASSFASLSILVWALQFSGLLPYAYLQGPMWHAHEMLFGFTLAVLTGFLLTAGQNWSGQSTPKGAYLGALAALWVAGRILVLSPWGWLAAGVNVAFPLAAATALAIPLYRARNRRNYFFVGLLLLMAVAQLGVHLDALGALRFPGWAGIGLGLDVMLFVLSVMAGRVIPMFTNNAIPGAKAVRHPWVEKLALGLILLLMGSDAMHVAGAWVVLIGVLAMLAHLTRLWLWHPWKTLNTPLVWVLHAAYAWIPIHLAFRAMAAMGWVSPSVATHALTAGAIGTMVIGMMTRTALGHTGRKLAAGKTEVACYSLVSAAAVIRVFVPLLNPSLLTYAVLISAAMWSFGFALYTVRYWGILAYE